MHKFFDGKNKAWKKALYAFLVGASLIFLLFAIIKFPSISSYVGGVVKAMAAFIYGFVLAFICNPIYKRLHKYVFRFVDIRKPHPQIRNLLSIITTYLIFGVIIAIVVRAVIPEILENWEELVGNIGTYIEELYNFAKETLVRFNVENPDKTIQDFLLKLLNMLNITNVSSTESTDIMQAIIDGVVDKVSSLVAGAFSHIFSFIVGFILSFYFLLSKNSLIAKVKRALIALFSEKTYKRISHYALHAEQLRFPNQTHEDPRFA